MRVHPKWRRVRHVPRVRRALIALRTAWIEHDGRDYAFAEVDAPYLDEDGILIDPNAPGAEDEDDEPAELDFDTEAR